jgi:hypothetical protein
MLLRLASKRNTIYSAHGWSIGHVKIDWTQPIIVPGVGKTFVDTDFGKGVIEKLNGIGLRIGSST